MASPRLTVLPRTMTRPFGEVDLLADLGHHVPLAAVWPTIAGVMNFVRMSASVSSFLFMRCGSLAPLGAAVCEMFELHLAKIFR